MAYLPGKNNCWQKPFSAAAPKGPADAGGPAMANISQAGPQHNLLAADTPPLLGIDRPLQTGIGPAYGKNPACLLASNFQQHPPARQRRGTDLWMQVKTDNRLSWQFARPARIDQLITPAQIAAAIGNR